MSLRRIVYKLGNIRDYLSKGVARGTSIDSERAHPPHPTSIYPTIAQNFLYPTSTPVAALVARHHCALVWPGGWCSSA